MIQCHLASNQLLALCQLYCNKLLLSYLFHRYTQALENACLTEQYLVAAKGLIHVQLFSFYDALLRLAIYPAACETEKISILDRVADHQEKLQEWSTYAPSNQSHRCMLVAAERYRVLDEKAKAIEHYDLAIAAAKANGYIQEEALANELAAKFYLDWGKEKIAQDYLTNAYYGYARWGAKAKVQDLECRYPELLSPILQQQQIPLFTTETIFATPYHTTVQARNTQSSTSGSTSISDTLDLATVLKASQTLSSEIQLDKLLAAFLHTVLENAGADKGALLMPRESDWFVEAIATLDQPTQVQSVALSSSQEISHTLINTVKRSLKPVVIVDAASYPTLADSYVVQRQSKSILCTPILRQGQLIAILYLENQVTFGAFTSDRVELLNVLCAQAAISLENARLYQTLQQNELKYRAFVEDVNDVIYSVTPDAIFTYLAPQFETVWGYQVSAFLNQSFLSLVHPEDLPKVLAAIQQLVATGEKQSGIEFRTQHQDESWFWVTCNNSPIKDEQGQVIGLRGVAHDISDRKATETALSESETKFRRLVEDANDVIWSSHLDSTVTYISPQFQEIFGWQPEEWVGKPFVSLVHPEDLSSIEKFVNQVIESGEKSAGHEFRHICKDGSWRWITPNISPIKDENGIVIGLQGILRDISDRKSTEDALRESEQRFRDVTEAAGEYIWEIDANSIYTYVTEKSKQVKGYTPAQLLGHCPIEFMPPEDIELVGEILAEAAARKGSFTLQHRDILPTGEVVWEEVNGLPMFNTDGEVIGFRGTGLSITDRKRAECQIQQKNQELEQAFTQLQHSQAQVVQSEKMSALGNLVAGVAHEINNPIGFLNGSINNARDYVQDLLGHLALYQQHHPSPAAPIQDNAENIDLEFLNEDLPKLLNSMKGATDRIKGISTSLRTFSRADTDYKVSANLHQGIDSTLLILKYRLKANEHRPAIEVIQDYGEVPAIECFPGQLNQVFMNILANAIDMFDEMAQTQSLEELEANPQKITIRTAVDADQVQIQICDNGIGMTEDVKAKIFDHLFTTKGVGKGTGLGLAIARQIVVGKHSGSLEVQSEMDRGTEFLIRLPIY
jgi:PAS domain S-box-containing protein